MDQNGLETLFKASVTLLLRTNGDGGKVTLVANDGQVGYQQKSNSIDIG